MPNPTSPPPNLLFQKNKKKHQHTSQKQIQHVEKKNQKNQPKSKK
jgi:hypothetical protein